MMDIFRCLKCGKVYTSQTDSTLCCYERKDETIISMRDQCTTEDEYISRAFIEMTFRAKNMNMPFKLTFVQFKRLFNRKRCEISNIILNNDDSISGRETNSLYLIVIDNEKGFVNGNVMAVARVIGLSITRVEKISVDEEISLETIVDGLVKYKERKFKMEQGN